MVREYIGARYVPKFFNLNGSNNWVGGVAYEALTVVTYLNQGYTSVKPVPVNIGNPADNPDYWVLSSAINSQIQDLQNQINNITVMSLTDDTIQYPSDNPMGDQREQLVIRVPASVNKFVDNVIGIQNQSHGPYGGNPDVYGNAAIAFFDGAQVERGAIGYSRENSIQPAGYVANTLYIEAGNPFGSAGTDTNFRVIMTNSTNFENTSFYPFEHISSTGITNIRGRGEYGGIHLIGGTNGVGVGNIAENEIGIFTIDNTHTNTLVREYFAEDRVGVCYNIYGDQRGTLDSSKMSMILSYGVDSPSSGFNTSNATGQKGIQLDVRPVNDAWYTIFRMTNDGMIFVGGDYESSAGYDGTICATNGLANRATATFKSNFALQPGLLIHNKNDSDTTLMLFGSGATYTQVGSITYSSGSVNYNTTSDYRIKHIDKELENALDIINEIKIYQGTIGEATETTAFCLAHELQSVLPYCVTGEKDAIDQDGNPILQQVDYSKIIPVLVKAIQELSRR